MAEERQDINVIKFNKVLNFYGLYLHVVHYKSLCLLMCHMPTLPRERPREVAEILIDVVSKEPERSIPPLTGTVVHHPSSLFLIPSLEKIFKHRHPHFTRTS